MLHTLGGLFLASGERKAQPFNRPKPLLLVAYLALEGPKARRHLAELFWPEAQDPLNSLSVALSQLRPLKVVSGSEILKAEIETDLHALRQALAEGDFPSVCRLYRGGFLEGVEVPLGEELSEWVWSMRERVALEVYRAYRKAARARYALGLAQEAEACLKEAEALPGVRWALDLAEEAPPDPTPLPKEARRVYWALLLDRKRAQEVVELRPEVLDLLCAEGLLSPGGVPFPMGLELPLEGQEMALELARKLPLSEALPFYQKARALWREEDQRRAGQALLTKAQKLLFEQPLLALELLEEAPSTPKALLLKARALERLGRYREALKTLEELSPSPEASALRAVVAFRLGRVEEALKEVEVAKRGEAWAQGEALNLRGLYALSRGEPKEAARFFARAAVRFLAAGEAERQVGALNNRAIALFEAGDPDAENVFQEALEAAGNNPLLRARVALNLGVVREKGGHLEEAEALYREALAWAEEAASFEAMGRAWNNLGALYHRLGRAEEAEAAYRKALHHAQEAQEWLLMAAALANLAELKGDPATLEEAVRLLEEAGHTPLAERYRARLETLGG